MNIFDSNKNKMDIKLNALGQAMYPDILTPPPKFKKGKKK